MIVGLFLGCLLFLGITAGSTYLDAQRLVRTHGELERQLRVALAVDLIRSELANCRIEQSEFTLTGDVSYLEYAERSLSEARRLSGVYQPHLVALQVDPTTHETINQLQSIMESKLEGRQREAVATLQRDGIVAAQNKLRSLLLADDDQRLHRMLMAFRSEQGFRVRATGAQFELQLQRAVSSGVLGIVLLAATILVALTGKYVQARQSAEETIYRSEQRIRAIADNMLDGLLGVDSDGRIAVANSTAASMLGLSVEQLYGTNIKTYVKDNLEFNLFHEQLKESKVFTVGGNAFEAEIAVSPVSMAGSYQGLSSLVTIRDISARKAAEKWRRDFVSTITRDLFMPLEEVRRAISNVARSSKEVPDKIRQLMTIGERNTDRLLSLINDLSDLESLSSGHLRLQPRQSSLTEIVARSIEAVRSLAEQRRINIDTDLQADSVFADPDRTVQVLVNFLSNALKFAPEQSAIAISSSTTGGKVLVCVQDRGRGISSEIAATIFERYKQARADDAKSGTGLGLPICKMIVEQQGGTIGVNSTPGEGSKFWFTLPVSPGDDHLAVEVTKPDAVFSWTDR